MLWKSFLLTSVILFCYLVFFGQSGFPYYTEWKLIDSLMNKKNLPKSALVEVDKVHAAAKMEKNEAQWVRAVIYRNQLLETEDRNISQAICVLESEIASAPPRVSELLKSIEAEQLFEYLQRNRYHLQSRTTIETDISTDIGTWTTSKLNRRINFLYLASLENPDLLKRTPLEGFNPILITGNARQLRPTLYDLLAWRALDYLQNDFQSSFSANDELVENPALFSEALYFMHFGFKGSDSISNQLTAIKLYQELLKFHAKDVYLDAWIDADIHRIKFVRRYAKMSDVDSLYLIALGHITSQFGTLSISSEAWYLQARWWSMKTGTYDPFGDTSQRFDNLKAISLCEKALVNPDSSQGKSSCEELKKEILGKDYHLSIEQVNIPRIPLRALVTYKNVNRIYGRIIAMSNANRYLFDKEGVDLTFWERLVSIPFSRSFSQSLPETNDYQLHSVEIKIDALEIGQYALLTSSDSAFSEKAVLGLTTFYCSSIAYVNNKLDYFVVDRNSGHPLQGVIVKIFVRKYNEGKNSFVLEKTCQTDNHGYFKALKDKEFQGQKMLFYLGRDSLSTNQYSYDYQNRYENDKSIGQKAYEMRELRDRLFTDRSIYRPGQTVYFKGILITKDYKTKRFKIPEPVETTLFLMDVNNQKVDSVHVKSNEFGSVSGSFYLPVNLLNGEFRIFDSLTQGGHPFSVEEYKRPTFYMKLDSITTSFRLGDTIHLTGSAWAYAGNQIDGAKVSWRVFREPRFPYPWLLRNYSSVSRTEITHGESTTNAMGTFGVEFIATPDKSVNKAFKPVYSYYIDVTATDPGGESRSVSRVISVSYQSFEIESTLPFEGRMMKDSFYQLAVTTKNASGIFLKEKLSVSVFPLQGPSRLIRKRYWREPDQFVMSEFEFLRAFPNDEYRNELDISTWKTLPAVFEKTDSTRENGIFRLDRSVFSALKPGMYVLEFKAKDKFGGDIVVKRNIELTDSAGNSDIISYNLVPFERIAAVPGNLENVSVISRVKELFVIRAKQEDPISDPKYSFYHFNQYINRSPVKITEEDRGGFGLCDVFIKNNRFYQAEHIIQVPWKNKELKITYQTWKDKTQPDSRELWRVKIDGNKNQEVAAEVLTTMYDISLDQFTYNYWPIPNLYSVYDLRCTWDGSVNFRLVYSAKRFAPNYPIIVPVHTNYDFLISGRRTGNTISRSGYDMVYTPEDLQHKQDLNAAVSGVKMDVEEYVAFKKDLVASDVSQTASEIIYKEVGGAIEMNKNPDEEYSSLRKNFNETAFFKPDLKTDAQGNVDISFTMPEALTRWKWMILAHTKDLAFGYSEKEVVSQKELMAQTNMPRFFREGDRMLLPVKMANLSGQNMDGTVQLEWLDAQTNQPLDQAIGNLKPIQSFSVNASQSTVVFFPAVIPVHFSRPILYRVQAKTDLKGTGYSDGEEAILPVLSNRMLVTESMPIHTDGQPEKHVRFDKLLKSGSSSLQNQGLTVEYTTNPSWYAVLSLPYLMEFPYDCAEQTFNSFYANALAAHIVQVSPAMQAILQKWEKTDTAALMSNLQKNEELKSALLRETPWVLEAQSETEQKKNLALLFDMLKMRSALKSALNKLQQMQSEGGGFPWFKGGLDDRYITQYILSGIGRLKKLSSIPVELQTSIDQMIKSGLTYLDGEINADFEKRDKWPAAQNLSPIQIQYLYLRGLFPEMAIPVQLTNAVNYYRKLSVENWMKQSVYMQGMIALFLEGNGDGKTARDILASLKENAVVSSELGMYWKSVNDGYYWQEAPVETQALLIETFQDLHGDQKDIDQMKYWLLQQKHTRHWSTTKATADACYALLLTGTDWLSSPLNLSIQLGSYPIHADQTEAGTGYFKKRIPGNEVVPEMGDIRVTFQAYPDSIHQQSSIPPSWGAVYWQYFENLDKISDAKTSLSVTKNLFIKKNGDHGPVLEAVTAQNMLKPGDKLVIRLVLTTDRDLEYVHLKDMRAGCLEPVNVLSGYRWQDGLGYYETTRDASTSFFFDRLPKGVHVFEYPVFVTTAGNYSDGVSSLECMYAPEFAAHSEGIRLQVESK